MVAGGGAPSDLSVVRDGLDCARIVRRRSTKEIDAMARVLAARLAGALDVASLMDFFYRKMGESKVARPAVACRKGCAHCCLVWVSVSAPEVLHLAAAIPPAVRNAVAAGAAETAKAVAGMGPEARSRAQRPCPLLVDDACSAYAGRPVVCRKQISTDESLCRRAFLGGEHIRRADLEPQMMQAGMFINALDAAARHLGLKLGRYELGAALHRTLTTPDAARRWLSGEDVFTGVQEETETTREDFPYSPSAILDRAFGRP